MAAIGLLLRETREAKGLTLNDVEQATRIQSRYLEALEDEEYDRLPGEVYVRGFLRNYARFLGIDLEARLAEASGGQASASKPNGARGQRLRLDQPVYVPLDRLPSRTLLRVVLVLMIVAVVAGGGYWGYRTFWATGRLPLRLPAFLDFSATVTATVTVVPTVTLLPATVTSTIAAPANTATPAEATVSAQLPAATETTAPTLSPIPVVTDTPAPTSTPVLTDTPAPTATPTITRTPTVKVYRGVEVAIVLRERSWLQVTVDGVRVHEGILEAGDTRKWEGTHSVALRAGNGGGVVVKLNGELLGPLGEKDEVIDIEWVRTGPSVIENPSGSGPVAAVTATAATPETVAGNVGTPLLPADLPG